METAEVIELVGAVAGIDPACRNRDVLCSAIAASARLRAWLDSRDVQLAAQLAELASFPEQAIADAAGTSLRDASRVLDRARTVEAMPALGDALASGGMSGAKVDVVGAALRRLEPAQRPALIEQAENLVTAGTQGGSDEFRQLVAGEVRRIQRDDGMARLERQKRATRLRSWVDREGMWCLSGRFDPETGLLLHNRLTATVDALFAEQVPDQCPADPLERQGFLRAHALVVLTEGNGQRAGRPEIVVVVDTTAVDAATGGPVIDWGYPIEIPDEVLHRLLEKARLRPVVVGDGGIVLADGQLNLGRTTRLANRAQRRVLRALYPTCAIPGCPIRFEICKLHHVAWWENGGATDLANLLPLCCSHHHAVHDRHWQLTLTPRRELTIDYPDGTRQIAGPPRRGPLRQSNQATRPDVRTDRNHPLRT